MTRIHLDKTTDVQFRIAFTVTGWKQPRSSWLSWRKCTYFYKSKYSRYSGCGKESMQPPYSSYQVSNMLQCFKLEKKIQKLKYNFHIQNLYNAYKKTEKRQKFSHSWGKT